MKKILLTYLLFFVLYKTIAQVTIHVTGIPANTPATDNLFIAGNFNNWNPNDTNFKLTKIDKGYKVIVPNYKGNEEYKFTRGSWTTAEGDSNGNVIKNRTLGDVVNGVINVYIAGWEDKKIKEIVTSTALPNVKIISTRFFIPQLNKFRRVWIYLPNDYETNLTKRYPVL
jgi:hypothetical protein